MTANVSDWIAYDALNGVVVADDELSAQALHRAKRYIRIHYLEKLGIDESNDKAVEAAYIAAGYELATPNFWSTTYTPSEQKVLTKVGDIQWTVTGGASGPDAALPMSPAIDALLMTGSRYGLPAVMTV